MDDQDPGFTRERLFAMATGHQASAVLRAAVGLGVFDVFADRWRDAPAVAALLGTDPRATSVLLDALAGLGLLTTDGADFALAPGVRELLVSTEPTYGGGVTSVAASAMEWHTLGELATTVRTGRPPSGTDSLVPDFPYWVDFATHTTFASERLAALVADALLPFLANRSAVDVLDVGCGPGIVGFELAASTPGVRVWAQDWPSVLEVAERHAKQRGVGDRVSLLPGDAFEVPLGGPYDVIVVSNLLCHFPPERATALLRRLVTVLAPDGRLVVAGFTSGDQPAPTELRARLLGLLMLSTTPGGEVHSTAAYRDMLAAAGLTDVRVHTAPRLLPRVMVAGRPGPADRSGRDVR